MGDEENTKEFVISSNDNEIVEITEEDYKEDFASFEQDVKPSDEPIEMLVERDNEEQVIPKKEKKSLIKKFKELPKKKKVTIIIAIILFFVIGGVVLFLVLRKPEEVKPTKPIDIVVIEKENYRYENGSLVFLNSNDEEIGKYECQNKDENYCYIVTQGSDDFDEEKYVYEDGSKLEYIMPIIDEKFAFIVDSKENNPVSFLYDLETNEKKDNYTEVKDYKLDSGEYLALKNTENKYALYKVENKELNQVIAPSYSYLGIIANEANLYNALVGEKDGRYYIIGFDGIEKSKRIAYPIKSFNENTVISCDEEGNYRVLDYNNNIIFSDVHEYIMLQGNLIITIDNRSLNVYDRNQNKLLTTPIRLSSTDYIKTRVFDSNKKQVELKETFWIIENDGSITIEYEDVNGDIKSSLINIYESLVSNNYKYVSYYDGLLYFYSDLDKTDLLGTYKCNNENGIVNESSKYNNCYIARESKFGDNELTSKSTTLGYIPIINGRFVFINDTLDIDNQNIILYDLVANKTLGNYLDVDLGLYNGLEEASVLNNSEQIVIYKTAKQKNYGKMGAFSIGMEKATSILSGDNDYVERIGLFIEAKKQSGTYQLFDTTGTSISSEVGHKIVNYTNNLIKTKSDDKYIVYDYEGHAVPDSNPRTYVDIKDDYFVTVVDRKITIYELDNDNPLIYDEEICGFDCYVSTKKEGSSYSVKIKNSDGADQTVNITRNAMGEDNEQEE